jgi:hypothetical protein
VDGEKLPTGVLLPGDLILHYLLNPPDAASPSGRLLGTFFSTDFRDASFGREDFKLQSVVTRYDSLR